jgi:hypothetical protein
LANISVVESEVCSCFFFSSLFFSSSSFPSTPPFPMSLVVSSL